VGQGEDVAWMQGGRRTAAEGRAGGGALVAHGGGGSARPLFLGGNIVQGR
jgi:hypothetical protein